MSGLRPHLLPLCSTGRFGTTRFVAPPAVQGRALPAAAWNTGKPYCAMPTQRLRYSVSPMRSHGGVCPEDA